MVVMVMVVVIHNQGPAVTLAVGWLETKATHGVFKFFFDLFEDLTAEGAMSRSLLIVVVVIIVTAPGPPAMMIVHSQRFLEDF